MGRASFSLSPELRALHTQLGIAAEILAKRNLAPVAEAADFSLCVITAAPHEIKLAQPAANAWISLRDAAASDGIVLLPVSGFRSIEYQASLFRRKLDAGKTVTEILSVNAPPGFSEHHSARALDLVSPDFPRLEEAFAETAAFNWLTQNATDFGFRMSYPHGNSHGFAFEPWHWCWLET